MKYRQIVRTISETPWAILPSTFAVIRDIVATRADGGKMTQEEIHAALNGRGTARQSENVGTVAVLPLFGVLIPRANMISAFSGGTSLEQFSAAFRRVIEDESIDAVVIHVDSPGGSVYQVPETAKLIRDARSVKPVVAVANSLACSAAYHLASQASEFVMAPSGLVGSIGVFAAHEDISKLQEDLGIKTTLISAGEFKTEGNPFEPLSDEARAAIQSRIDDFYGMFVRDVALGRKVSEQTVREDYGRGRVVTAEDALAAGMVDRIDTFEATIARLLEDAAGSEPGGVFGASANPLLLALIKAGREEAKPDDPLPDGYSDLLHDIEAAHSGLTFADEAEAARDAVDLLVARTRSLAETRRGRLTAAKREQLTALRDTLVVSCSELDDLLAQTTPNTHADDISNELLTFERLRATI